MLDPADFPTLGFVFFSIKSWYKSTAKVGRHLQISALVVPKQA